MIKVFYLDFGKTETLNIKQIYPIKQQFLNTPFQYCMLDVLEFGFSSINPSVLGEFFESLNNRTNYYVATVVRNTKIDRILQVNLFAKVPGIGMVSTYKLFNDEYFGTNSYT